MGRKFSWCSENVTRKSLKTAKVLIPGSILEMFEVLLLFLSEKFLHSFR